MDVRIDDDLELTKAEHDMAGFGIRLEDIQSGLKRVIIGYYVRIVGIKERRQG